MQLYKHSRAALLRVLGSCFALAVLLMATVPAHAQAVAPTTIDVAAAVTSAKGDLIASAGPVVPLVFGLMALFIAVGYGIKRFKSAAKSS
jgi:hypothetical protein